MVHNRPCSVRAGTAILSVLDDVLIRTPKGSCLAPSAPTPLGPLRVQAHPVFNRVASFLDHELVTDPELVARHERWIDLAMAHATPYVEYLAQDPTRELPRTGVV